MKVNSPSTPTIRVTGASKMSMSGTATPAEASIAQSPTITWTGAASAAKLSATTSPVRW